MTNMKKVMMTTAAVALAFGLSPMAGAQTVDNGSAAASDYSKPVVKSDNSMRSKPISHIDGKAKASELGAAANNHSTASTSLDLSLTNAFNQTKVVNYTKLEGTVSHNKVYDIGNYGGDATNKGDAGNGGDGGNAKAIAYSGKAVGGDGGNGGKARSGDSGYADADGGYAKGGKGYADADGGYAKGGKGYADADGGYAKGGKGGPSNGANDSDNNSYNRKNNDIRDNDNNGNGEWKGGNGGYAEGGDAKAKGGNGGYAEGGDAKAKSGDTGYAKGGKGGDGGYAESGNATATAAGGNGAAGGHVDVRGGDAGTFNASNTLSGLSGASGVTIAMQNTGIAALQQVGVTTMATVNIGR